VFVGANGQEYTWKTHHDGSLELQDPQKQSVATFQPPKIGIFSKSRDGALEVQDREAHEMLDMVVLSFLIMRRNAVASSNMAAGAALMEAEAISTTAVLS